jgi:dipeptidyl aminopeptidase/acylaminoacyl peptidase
MPATAPYGSWASPITADLLVQRAVSLDQLAVSGDAVFWLERRPSDRGRQVVVRWRPGQGPVDVVPAGFSARTTVHEYGGGDYTVHRGTVIFSNFDDQRLYRVAEDGAPAEPITPEPAVPGSVRYADADVSPDGLRLACVRERHLEHGDVVNDLVVVPADGSAPPSVLADGHDFFSAPRFSPDGTRLAWLSWDHPRMPWDGTELWVDGARVAGGPVESVSQPRWSPTGVLHWVSDATGWWNVYAAGRPVAPLEAEFTRPDWVFGQSTYDFLPDGRVVAACTKGPMGRLLLLERGAVSPFDTPYTAVSSLRTLDDRVVAIAASPEQPPAVVSLGLTGDEPEVIRRSRDLDFDARHLSRPRPIAFTAADGTTAHALHYPPPTPTSPRPPGSAPHCWSSATVVPPAPPRRR